MHGWIPIADEYGARLKLMDAICLGKQSYLRQYFWSRLFSPSLSREESVSVISDIYSRDGSWGEHAQHSKAGTYRESGQFKGIWESGLCFHWLVSASPSHSHSLCLRLSLIQNCSPQFRLEGQICGWVLLSLFSKTSCPWKIFVEKSVSSTMRLPSSLGVKRANVF